MTASFSSGLAQGTPSVPPTAAATITLGDAAEPLLRQLPRLRALPERADLAGLHRELTRAVKRFDAQVRHAGLPASQVAAARYVLCAALDDAVQRTAWGRGGAWTPWRLLVRFHHETADHDRVFELLSRLTREPARHVELLRLILAVLAAGFEGRYRGRSDGAQRLAAQRRRIDKALQRAEGGVDRPPVATPARARTPRPGHAIWLWPALGAALTLVTVFVWLAGPGRSQATTGGGAPAAGVTTGVGPALAPLLAGDVAAGHLTLRELPGRVVVTLAGDALFDSGDITLRPDQPAVLMRLGSALAGLPGEVLVSGHMDSASPVSDRFPSPWHLSQARAQAVRDRLAVQVDPGRLSVEGRADTEPVDDNALPSGQARNRRVEVTLRPPVSPSATSKAQP